eukprot:RCo014627
MALNGSFSTTVGVSQSSKFAEILKFLDNADAEETYSTGGAPSVVSLSASHVKSTADSTVTDLRAKIEALAKKVSEKDAALVLLKEKLGSRKTKETSRIEQLLKGAQAQKEEFEAAASRNMEFIRTLLQDKEQLNKRVEVLSVELKNLETKHQTKLEEAEQRHADQMSAQKQLWEKAEKRRRAQWAEEHGKKIKDGALKALEPEIAQLMNRHRQEKARLEEEKQEALRRKDAALAQREEQLSEARRRMEADKELELRRKDALLLEKDRELLEQRARLSREFEQSLVHERELFHQQNKEICDRFERQLDEQRVLLRESKAREEDLRRRLETQLAAEKTRLEMDKDHRVSLAQSEIRLELEADFGAMKKELEKQFAEDKAKLKEQLRQERDREIELVIQKLEDGAIAAAKDQKATERQLTERCQALQRERDALAQQSKELGAKYADAVASLETKGKLLREHEIQLADAAAERERRVSEVAQVLSHKAQQADDLWSCKYTKKIQEQLQLIEQQAARVAELQAQLQTHQRAHQEGIAQLTAQHSRELDLLQAKFQQALSKKDKMIADLTATAHQAEERVQQLELGLQQLEPKLVLSPSVSSLLKSTEWLA